MEPPSTNNSPNKRFRKTTLRMRERKRIKKMEKRERERMKKNGPGMQALNTHILDDSQDPPEEAQPPERVYKGTGNKFEKCD